MHAQFTIGFKRQTLWTSLAAVDFFLAGAGAGVYLLSLYLGLTGVAAIGPAAVILGAVALLADLGRPERFWRAGSRVAASWISRGVVFTSVFVVCSSLVLAPGWLTALPWGPGTVPGLVLGILAALGAVGVMVYPGFLLSASSSVPFWNTALLPLLFTASALTCGAGAVFVTLPALGVAAIDLRSPALTGMLLLAVTLVLLGFYLLSMRSAAPAARESVRLLTRGSLAWLFLGGAVAVGLVIPLVLTVAAAVTTPGPGTSALLAVAGVLVLAGGYLFRHCILKAGVQAPIW